MNFLWKDTTISKPWFFDTCGFNGTLLENEDENKSSKPMVLVGIGMRTYSLYIVSLDIYLIGFYLSEDLLKCAKNWDKQNDEEKESKSLPDYLLENENISGIENTKNMCIKLQMQRNVAKKDFLNAFQTGIKYFYI
jgi:hypothetical protein